MKYIKQKLFILFGLVPLLLSCSSQMDGKKAEQVSLTAAESAASGSPSAVETDTAFLVAVPENADPGLFLYTKPATRLSVVEFYTSITGDVHVAQAIIRGAAKYDVPLSLAFALAFGESDYNNWAVNANADSVDRGLFQLNSKTFPDLPESDFFDPDLNAAYGLRFFRWCMDQGNNDVVAIAIYNAGLSRVEFGGTPRMTLDHINNIIDYRSKLHASFIAFMTANPNLRISFGEPESPHALNLL